MKRNGLNFLLFSLLILLNACSEEFIISQEEKESATANQGFKSLKVPEGFTWETTNTISFQFKGNDYDERKAVLKITTPNNELIYQKLQFAKENYSVDLQIPATSQSLLVSYGADPDTLELVNNTLIFDLNK